MYLFRFDRLVRRVRILEQEREHVGSLFDALRDGFAGAVARLGVDADQDRSVAALGVLHLGGELERGRQSLSASQDTSCPS